MKQTIYSIVILFCLQQACVPKLEDPVYTGDNFVAFGGEGDTPTGSVDEGRSILIPVFRSSSDLSSAVTVSYSITSKVVETGDDAGGSFTVEGGANQVTIPAGASTATIQINALDNSDRDGERELTITLTSTSNGEVGYTGPDKLKSVFILTIDDNDCPFDIDTFIGTYQATETRDVITAFRSGGDVTNYNVIITGEDGSSRLTITDFLSFTSLDRDPESIFIDIDATGTVTIPDQTLQPAISAGNGTFRVVGIGTGIAQVCSGEITMEYQLYDDAGEIGRSTVILTK